MKCFKVTYREKSFFVSGEKNDTVESIQSWIDTYSEFHFVKIEQVPKYVGKTIPIHLLKHAVAKSLTAQDVVNMCQEQNMWNEIKRYVFCANDLMKAIEDHIGQAEIHQCAFFNKEMPVYYPRGSSFLQWKEHYTGGMSHVPMVR